MLESDKHRWGSIHGFDDGCAKAGLINRIDGRTEAKEGNDIHGETSVSEVQINWGIGGGVASEGCAKSIDLTSLAKVESKA